MSDTSRDFDPLAPLDRGTTVLEASAGTGKTHTVTSLVLRFVLEYQLEVAQILVVTFTRAATAELRQRIRQRLANAAQAALDHAQSQPSRAVDPIFDALLHTSTHAESKPSEVVASEMHERLRRAIDDLAELTIATIHGFCQQTLARAALDGHFDLDARLEADSTPLLTELVDDYRDATLRDSDPAWYRELTRSAKLDRTRLLELARLVEDHPEAEFTPPLPEGAHEAAPDDDGVALGRFAGSSWVDDLRTFVDAWPEHGSSLVATLIAGAKSDPSMFRPRSVYNTKQPKTKGEAVDRLGQTWQAGTSPPADLVRAVRYFARSSIAAQRLDGRADDLDNPLPDLADRCFRDSALIYKHGFARYLRQEIPRRRAASNTIAYGDLLHGLASALDRNPQLAPRIRAQMQVALIDEFQDTDPVQWSIFERLFGEDAWLILVGDPKQAIYGFRGADIRTYLRASRSDHARRRTLGQNWRSDAQYVQAINHVFAGERRFADPQIDSPAVRYAPHHARPRIAANPSSPAALTLRFIARSQTRPADDPRDPLRDITATWAAEHLPSIVADDIVTLLAHEPRYEASEGSKRPLGAADVAVLVRTNRQAALVRAALVSRGLDARVNRAGDVFDSPAALALGLLCRAMLAPQDARACRAAALALPFGFDRTSWEGAGDPRFVAWLEELRRWSQRWRHAGIHAAVRDLLRTPGLRASILAGRDGARMLTDLSHLAQLLEARRLDDHLGPERLAQWLVDQIREPDARLAGQAPRSADEVDRVRELGGTDLRRESDEPAVTVMTMHASKGLEFPVVYCPYLWESRSKPDQLRTRVALAHHDPRPNAPAQIELSPHDDDPRGRAIAERVGLDMMTEDLRLCYVAITRAESRAFVYWGKFTGSERSAPARLFHGGDDNFDPEDFASRDDDELLADLRAFAEDSDGSVAVAPVERTDPEGTPARAENSAPAIELAARSRRRRQFDFRWGRHSFSTLSAPRNDRANPAAQAGLPPTPGLDEAEAPPAANEAETATNVPSLFEDRQVPLANFPAGPRWGTFLHAFLEHAEFDAAAQLESESPSRELLITMMQRHGVDPRYEAMLANALHGVLTTPLAGQFETRCLADVLRPHRIDELDFDLALAGGYDRHGDDHTVEARELAAILKEYAPTPSLRDYAQQLEGLAFDARGFLTGSIDLVVRTPTPRGGRFHVIDYKSNRLGPARDPKAPPDSANSPISAYAPRDLAEDMGHHHYHLQAVVYAVALHRHLRYRLGTDYDPEHQLGDVYYLYLRGMLGSDAPRDERGGVYGVHCQPVTPELISALDDALRGEPRS